MPKPDLEPEGEALPAADLTAEAVLAACGGDAKVAIDALIADVATLRRELALTRLAVSNGYSRGWHRRLDRPV